MPGLLPYSRQEKRWTWDATIIFALGAAYTCVHLLMEAWTIPSLILGRRDSWYEKSNWFYYILVTGSVRIVLLLSLLLAIGRYFFARSDVRRLGAVAAAGLVLLSVIDLLQQLWFEQTVPSKWASINFAYGFIEQDATLLILAITFLRPDLRRLRAETPASVEPEDHFKAIE